MVISRIFVFTLAVIVFILGICLIFNNDKIYKYMEKLHEQIPIMAKLNPISKFNSLCISKVASVFMGVIAILMSLLLLIVVFFGKEE